MTDLEERANMEVSKVFQITAENAIRDMAIAMSLSITKDGKYFGAIASQYLDKMKEYVPFCIEGTWQQWENALYNILCSKSEENVEERINVLKCYELAGSLMKRVSEETVMDVVAEYEDSSIDSATRGFAELLLLIYSKYGSEFMECLEKIRENREKKVGIDEMKITQDTTAEEVKADTMKTLYAMCEDRSGMSEASAAMDNFMEKLDNGELEREFEPSVGEDFDPNEEEAERILAGFNSILEEIKELKLK
ncbi:MAG: hypothetical protein OSJ70_02035 [Bacilli bacterium]|nr:hypothetical protein [Bacilli bacterium]